MRFNRVRIPWPFAPALREGNNKRQSWRRFPRKRLAARSNEKQQSLGKAERSVTSFNWLDRWGCPKGVSIDRYDQSPIDPKGFTLHYPTRSESGEALLPAGFFASFGHANGNEHGGGGEGHP